MDARHCLLCTKLFSANIRLISYLQVWKLKGEGKTNMTQVWKLKGERKTNMTQTGLELATIPGPLKGLKIRVYHQ